MFVRTLAFTTLLMASWGCASSRLSSDDPKATHAVEDCPSSDGGRYRFVLPDGTKLAVYGQLASREQPAPWTLILSRYVLEPLAPSIWKTPLVLVHAPPKDQHSHVILIVNDKAIMVASEWSQDYFIVDTKLGNTLEIGHGDYRLSRIAGKMTKIKIRFLGGQTLAPNETEEKTK